MGLLKLAQLLNVVHQVAPGYILHHEIQAILGRSGRGLDKRTHPLRTNVEGIESTE
jgi:hypothetical protein